MIKRIRWWIGLKLLGYNFDSKYKKVLLTLDKTQVTDLLNLPCQKGFTIDCGLPSMHTGPCITKSKLPIQVNK